MSRFIPGAETPPEPDAWEDQYSDPGRYRTWPSEEVIRFMADASPPLRVLDIGCGAGGNLWALLMAGHDAYGIDPSKAARRSAQAVVSQRCGLEGARVPVFHGYAQSIPFPDGFFHRIVEVTTLQHVLDIDTRRLVREECRRVLAPGGCMLSVHLIQGTKYEDTFGPLAPPALLPTAFVLGGEWNSAGFLVDDTTIVDRVGSGRVSYAVMRVHRP